MNFENYSTSFSSYLNKFWSKKKIDKISYCLRPAEIRFVMGSKTTRWVYGELYTEYTKKNFWKDHVSPRNHSNSKNLFLRKI